MALCCALMACTAEDLPGQMPAQEPSVEPSGSPSAAVPADALAGATIVIDAGHQLGNRNFPRADRLVPAGGFTKTCNGTGTATNAGFPEATFNFRVATRLKRQLERHGATVVMTRTRNSADLAGPCVDVRGLAGNDIGADLKVSIHADGSYTDGQGFHVIAPTDRAPWTDDIYRSSKRLAHAAKRGLIRAGFSPADYVAGGDGLDFRADLATLNLSDIPTVLVETGNMRNADEARVMSSRRGQYRYARGLLRGIRIFLTR
jgi:N-acetylmuramoyl-L-alanine amidase